MYFPRIFHHKLHNFVLFLKLKEVDYGIEFYKALCCVTHNNYALKNGGKVIFPLFFLLYVITY